jgi:hypothetical protein
MAVEYTEQIVREAPEIEAYKLGLLQDAKELADIGIDLPIQQIAGMSGLQEEAIRLAQAGIGGFQPFLDQGSATMAQAAPMINQAVSGSQGTTTQSLANMLQAAQSAQGIAGTGAANLRGISGEIPGTVSQAGQQTQQAIDAARGTVGRAATDLGAAGQFGRGAAEMGIAGLLGTGAQFDPGSIQAYMSPFEDAAVQQALADIRRQGDIAQQNIGAQAVGSGAFGGSRQAIAEQELQRNILDQQARTAAQLRAQGFESSAQRAQQAFEQALGRQQQAAGMTGQLGQAGAGTSLQAAQAAGQLGLSAEQLAAQTGLQMGQLGLQGVQQRGALEQEAARLGLSAEELAGRLAQQSGALGQSQAQIGLQAGQQLGQLGLQQASLGQLQQQLGQAEQESLFNFGQQQQLQDQAVLEAQRQSDLAQLYEPYQRVSFLSDIYRGAPSTQQSISASTAPNVSPAQQFIGTGIAGLSAAAGANKAGLFG